MARALDIHPALLELCHVRYREALMELPEVPSGESLLLLVGRGTSDPDANANIARISRFLWESYGVGWASVAFAGLASPGVDEALAVCRRMCFRRIIVQPFLLFDGILLRRIHETAQEHDDGNSITQIITTPHLGIHPLLVEAFEDRAHEAVHGTPRMNCDLCKYRVRMVGHEVDLGAPQEAHHHDVRGLDNSEVHLHGRQRRARDKDRHAAFADTIRHPWDQRLLEKLDLIN
jgi:hypothetical protein